MLKWRRGSSSRVSRVTWASRCRVTSRRNSYIFCNEQTNFYSGLGRIFTGYNTRDIVPFYIKRPVTQILTRRLGYGAAGVDGLELVVAAGVAAADAATTLRFFLGGAPLTPDPFDALAPDFEPNPSLFRVAMGNLVLTARNEKESGQAEWWIHQSVSVSVCSLRLADRYMIRTVPTHRHVEQTGKGAQKTINAEFETSALIA